MPSEPTNLSAPKNVDLMITRRCNLRCPHCSASPEQFTRPDLTTDELIQLIDVLASIKVFHVALTGGEPLLNPDFTLLARRVVSHPMRLQVNTNATLVTPEVARELRSLKRLPFISVSLDGITASTHDRIRGKGSFHRVVRGINILLSAGLPVRPFMVVSQLNYSEVANVVHFAKELGVDSVFLATPVSCGRGECYERDCGLLPDQLRHVCETALRIDTQNQGILDGPIIKMSKEYRRMKANAGPESNPKRLFRNCSAGITCAAIGSDGSVSPCQMAFSFQVGNVRDKPFPEIWKYSSALAELRGQWEKPLEEVQGCEACTWSARCAGPCPAQAYVSTRRWPAAEGMCMREMDRVLGGKQLVMQCRDDNGTIDTTEATVE